MHEYADFVEVNQAGSQVLGCKHCGGVVRVHQSDVGGIGRGRMLFIEDHKLSCGWGHGNYQPPEHIERRLASRLRQEQGGGV